MKNQLDSSLINCRDSSSIIARKPIIVAHRGGVITPSSPENSLAAIHLAGDGTYDMVELDVAEAKDGKPVLFHGLRGHLGRDCGVDAYVHELTAEELMGIRYRGSNQHITTLSEALKLCRKLRIGAMLDIKDSTKTGDTNSDHFYTEIAGLLTTHAMCNSSLSFSQDPSAYTFLRDLCMFSVTEEEIDTPLENRWWFGLPEQATGQLIAGLQQRGILVIVAINSFRYPPHAHETLAENDMQRLINTGVDGLQIDSCYYYQFVKHAQHTTLPPGVDQRL